MTNKPDLPSEAALLDSSYSLAGQVKEVADQRRVALAKAIYEARQVNGPVMAWGNRWEEMSSQEVYLRWADRIISDAATAQRIQQDLSTDWRD
jgi:hypothetical protein